MKHLRVPILTEEYVINVFIGTKEDLEKQARKYLGHPIEFVGHRGRAYNCLPTKQILILIDGSLSAPIALATVAHEASHAMDYIQTYLGMNDQSGEFHAHGIAAVMRAVGKIFLKKL